MITLVIGNDALCSDRYRGQVRAVVIDPAAGTVTHIVVEPEGRQGLARLVPLHLVDAASVQIRLRCTEAEFMNLDAAEETLAEFAVGETVPVQLLAPGWRGADGPSTDGSSILRIPEKETIDVIPPGEVEERGGDHVHATDGDTGQVRAFRIDSGSGQLTHVLVREGHAWGRRDVAIPFDKVTGLDGGIRLSITRQQVRDLPPVDIDHPAEGDRLPAGAGSSAQRPGPLEGNGFRIKSTVTHRSGPANDTLPGYFSIAFAWHRRDHEGLVHLFDSFFTSGIYPS